MHAIPPRRLAGIVGVLSVLGAAAVLLWTLGGVGGQAASRSTGAAPVVTSAALSGAGRAAARFPASDVLRRWDRSRSDAFAAGDVTALRDLYVDAAGAADVRLLEAYLRRGLRVEGMRMQILALEILADRPGVIRLRVTDRLTGAVAVGETGRAALPRDRASTRVLELRRRPRGAWRMAWVREVR